MSKLNIKGYVLGVITPGFVLGSGIGIMNFINIDKSPNFKKETNSINRIRFSSMIATKSIIYGTCYPIALLVMFFDLVKSTKHFESHFIPFSVHGKHV